MKTILINNIKHNIYTFVITTYLNINFRHAKFFLKLAAHFKLIWCSKNTHQQEMGLLEKKVSYNVESHSKCWGRGGGSVTSSIHNKKVAVLLKIQWEIVSLMPDCIIDVSIKTLRIAINSNETGCLNSIRIIYVILYTNYYFWLFQKIRSLYPNPANQAYKLF